MNTMTPDNITRMIDAMSVDELRMRLAAYMMAEQQKASQPVAQSRVAVRNAISASDDVEIARPQRHNGKTIVIFAANGGNVIVDNSLL